MFFLSRFSVFLSQLKESFRKERLLWLALVLCFGFSLIGAQWGKIEDWNPDQMAFRGVPNNLMVSDYLKPPLTTYAARLLVLNPVDCIMNGIFHAPSKLRLEVRVIGVRILTIFYLCVAVALIYFSILRCSGKIAASAISLIMATSAGLMAYTHYGTADMPVVFWMVASFAAGLHAALARRFSWGIAAGLLAGLSAACKYNGLGVAIAIPVFFLIQNGPRALLSKNLWFSSFAVPVGFILGCPGVIFDHTRFVEDFLYNLYTTPVYSGNISQAGYGRFLNAIPNIVGWPTSFLFLACITLGLLLIFLKRLKKEEVLLFAGAAAVFFFYFITIGRFPRMEMRFVMPVVPFLLVMTAPALARINKRLLILLLIPLVFYNLVCCSIVGWRFLSDPRMKADTWAEQHFKPGDLIESVYSPYWDDLIPGLKVIHTPLFMGHSERFKKIFGNNEIIAKGLVKFGNDPSVEIFTLEALKKRHPDYITFSAFAIFYSESVAKQYYQDHLAEKLGYHIVWQEQYWLPPQWAYPQRIDFLVPAMYILKKDEALQQQP